MSGLPPGLAAEQDFVGRPREVGGQIWHQMCRPVVEHVTQERSIQQVAELYLGFLEGGIASMAMQFGHQAALAMAQRMVDELAAQGPGMSGPLQ